MTKIYVNKLCITYMITNPLGGNSKFHPEASGPQTRSFDKTDY